MSAKLTASDTRRMQRILDHVTKVSPYEREWLMRRLAEVECCETEVGRVWLRHIGRWNT